MRIKTIFIIPLFFLLSGCANEMRQTHYAPDGVTKVSETVQPGSIFGPSPFDVGYLAMFQAHETGKTARVVKLSDVSSCPEADGSARAYCISLGKISGMVAAVMDRFDIKAPTTGMDVLYKLTDSVVPVMGIAGIWQTAVAGFDAAGSVFGPGATLNDSLNRTSSVATAAGAYPTSTSGASGTMPGATPIIVQPSYGP